MSDITPIDQSTLPADIRTASKSDQQKYASALSFEKMLVTQLTQQMADTTKPADDGSDSSDDSDDGATSGTSAATNAYTQMLPGVMADAITDSGGLGIARQIYDGMKLSGQ